EQQPQKGSDGTRARQRNLRKDEQAWLLLFVRNRRRLELPGGHREATRPRGGLLEGLRTVGFRRSDLGVLVDLVPARHEDPVGPRLQGRGPRVVVASTVSPVDDQG